MKFLIFFALACGAALHGLEVDADFAWRMAEQAVAAGPRHSGSEGAQRSAEWMTEELKKHTRFTIRAVTFEEETPAGRIAFCNLVAELAGTSPKFVVVGAHYDTKHLPELAGDYLGANDGASGTAALLAMIQALNQAQTPLPFGVRFVFFDGEECRRNYASNDGLHGSRHYVRSLRESGELADCRAMLLLDMIGSRDSTITFPKNSDPDLRKLALEEAAKRGHRNRFADYSGGILDDDLPFLAAGIPALNFIGFRYGPDNSYWHTAEDTLDKLSPQSLKIAADVALAVLLRLGETIK